MLLFPSLSVGATTVVPVVPGAGVVGLTVPVVVHALSLLSPPLLHSSNSFANFSGTFRALAEWPEAFPGKFKGSNLLLAKQPTCPVFTPNSSPCLPNFRKVQPYFVNFF